MVETGDNFKRNSLKESDTGFRSTTTEGALVVQGLDFDTTCLEIIQTANDVQLLLRARHAINQRLDQLKPGPPSGGGGSSGGGRWVHTGLNNQVWVPSGEEDPPMYR